MNKQALHESAFLKNVVMLASAFIVIAGIRAAATVVVPFILSMFISICCFPLVRYAERFRVPKFLSVSVLIALFLYLTFWLGGLLINSAQAFYLKIPEYNQELIIDMTRYESVEILWGYGVWAIYFR